MPDIFQPADEQIIIVDESTTVDSEDFEEDFEEEEEMEPTVDSLEGVTLIFGTEETVVLPNNQSLSDLIKEASDALGITDTSRIRFRYSGSFVEESTVPKPGEVYTLLVTGNSKA